MNGLTEVSVVRILVPHFFGRFAQFDVELLEKLALVVRSLI